MLSGGGDIWEVVLFGGVMLSGGVVMTITGSDIITPPSVWTDKQTGVKTLPCPKLRLRAVKIGKCHNQFRAPLDSCDLKRSRTFYVRIGGSNGRGARDAPPRPISFIFMHFLAEILLNNRLCSKISAPPRLRIRHWSVG